MLLYCDSCYKLRLIFGALLLCIASLFLSSTTLYAQPGERERQLSSTSDNEREDDATFLGMNVEYHPPGTSIKSRVNCVGENFHPTDSWMMRSCQFRNLCMDTQQLDFVVYPSAQEVKLQKLLAQRTGTSSVTLSTLLSPETSRVALGTILPEWTKEEVNRLQWFPRVQTTPPSDGYYLLPSNIVLTPFLSHSSLVARPSHVVWNEFWSLYKLHQIFHSDGGPSTQLFPLLVDDSNGDDHNTNGSTSSSTFHNCHASLFSNSTSCQGRELLTQYAPILLSKEVDNENILTLQQLAKQSMSFKKASILCVPNALAGIGLLSDDGLDTRKRAWMIPNLDNSNDQQQEQPQQSMTHNLARGSDIVSFSRFVRSNLGLLPESNNPNRLTTKKVTFALDTTHEDAGNIPPPLLRLQKSLARTHQDVIIEVLAMDQLSVREQAQKALESTVFVSVNGGGALGATVLTPPSSLVILILTSNDEGLDKEKENARVTNIQSEWAFFRNAVHLPVHWMSVRNTGSSDEQTLLDLILRLVDDNQQSKRAN